MKEEQFKVLKAMIETTTRMDLNTFAKKVNLSPNQAMQVFQELAKEGFLQRSERGYGVTEKGKGALKAFTPVPEEMGFSFYFGINQPAGLISKSLQEFYKDIKQVRVDSLEFHFYRGDFENWLKEACKEPDLADKMGCIKVAGLRGEDLRAALLEVLDIKYHIHELI